VATPPKSDSKRIAVLVNPAFSWILVVMVLIIFVSLGVMVWAASGNPPEQSELRKDLFITCKYAFVSGVSIFVGLAGGRVASPDSRK
jgi:hypothetical protein